MEKTSLEIKKDFKAILDKIGASNIRNIMSGIQFNIKKDKKTFVDTVKLTKKANVYDIEFWTVGINPFPTLSKSVTGFTKDMAHEILGAIVSK